MNQKTLYILTGILVLVGIYVFVFTTYLLPNGDKRVTNSQSLTPTTTQPAPQPTPSPKPTPTPTASDVHDATSVESYVKKHITEFSTVKAQLGGTFYVTRIETHGGAGTVYYEDGHSAYIADFKYSIDEFGTISVDSFKVRR